jgi:hypothetical protein
MEAGVVHNKVESSDGIDTSIIAKLGEKSYAEKYDSNKWIGRLGL